MVKEKNECKTGPYKNNLKEYRTKRGYTLKELSKLMQDKGYRISFSYISLLERGIKRAPALELAYGLTEVLKAKRVDNIFLPSSLTDSKKEMK